MYETMIRISPRQPETMRRILSRAHSRVGVCLEDIYKRPSTAKQAAFEWCRELYLTDDLAFNFHIATYNQQMFTVSWDTMMGGEQSTIFITPRYNYIILSR